MPAAFLLAAWAFAAMGRPAGSDESPADRRERIEKLSPAQKQDLLEHQQKFLKLDPSEQDRLRRLNRQLDDDPQGPELRRTMQRYYDWLKTLPSFQRAQLLDLSPEQRVKQVQKLWNEQAQRKSRGAAWRELARREGNAAGRRGAPAQPPKRLNPANLEGLFTWMDEYAKKHAVEMLEKLPPAHRERVKKGLAAETDPLRRQELIGWIWLWWQLNSPGKLPSLSDKELAGLQSKLSPATRKQLQALSPAGQWRMVSGLFTTFMLRQYAARHTGVPFQSGNEEELARFFEQVLTPKERDDLATLAGEDMQRALWRKYIAWKLRQLPPPRPGRGKRPATAWSRPGTTAAKRPKAKPGTAPAIEPRKSPVPDASD